jgi:hypothetical protein
MSLSQRRRRELADRPNTAIISASRPSRYGELMAQQQVLQHEVLARAHRGHHGHEQEPEEFEHAFSMADSGARGFAASQGNRPRSPRGCRSRRPARQPAARSVR